MLLKWYLFKTSILKRQEKASEEALEKQERLTEKLYKKYREKAAENIKGSNLPDDSDGAMFSYFEEKFMNRCFRFGPLSWGTIIDKFCLLMLIAFAVFMQLMVLFIKLGVAEMPSAFLSFPLAFILVGLWFYLDYVVDLKTIAECEVILDILSMRRGEENCYHFL